MKFTAFLAFVACLLSTHSHAQDYETYRVIADEAWALYESEDYLASAQKYSEAFVAWGNQGTVNDRYNAACSWALVGKSDSAFVQLFRCANKGNYTNLGHITTDTDLNSLHEDERWKELIGTVTANKEEQEKNYDKPLVAELESIYEEDQKYRHQIGDIEKEHGWESEEMEAHWKLINEKDSINLLKVCKILDERGWLGSDVVGGKGNTTLFLVIQHADIETQEKYLPMMREAVEEGNARASSLALLEDRVALRRGGKQLYGSQVGRNPDTGEYYVSPLEDPDHVDERREAMGLPPLQQYISNWGMTWDVEEYKKNLPALMEMIKKID